MKIILLYATLLPLSIFTMNEEKRVLANKPDKQIIIENASKEDITVYYLLPQYIQQYKMLVPQSAHQFSVLTPQTITIHFNKQDRQHTFSLSRQDSKLTIHQFNTIEIFKNDPS